MPQKLITVKNVALSNNCPECFNTEGLQLTFKQKFIETKFSKSITQEVKTEMTCSICNTTIYPERWTEAIERVFDYQIKAFTPKKTSRRFKRLFWVLIISITTIVVVIAMFLYQFYFMLN